MKKLLSKLNPRFKWRGVKGIRYNEDGVSAIEFALIAPVMVLLFFGCVELSLMMRADRRVTTTAASLGDLTARLNSVTNDDLRELFAAANLMMQPYDVNATRLRLTSIEDNGSGATVVGWSEGAGMYAYSPGTSLTVPSGIVPATGSVIMAEVEYDYTNTFGFMFDASSTFTDRFYLRPRRVDVIPRQNNGDPSDPSDPSNDTGGFSSLAAPSS